jgi:hypothetical protein
MRSKGILIFGSLILTVALWGCGGSGSGGDSTSGGDNPVDPDTGLSYVQASECISCHQSFSWSADDVAAYLEGKHVIHSNHIVASSEDVCLDCHDPLGDGPGIEQHIDAADVPAEGLAAVGCENCHGPGGEHFGVGPIPNPSPGPEVCGQCHDDQWDYVPEAAGHIVYHPEGNAIYSDWEASAHNNIHDGTVCAKCHTDQGAHLFKLADSVAALEAITTEIDNPQPIQCRTCHDPHNPAGLLEEEVVDRRTGLEQTAEYATCTNCHQKHDAQITVDGSGVIAITNLAGSTSSDGGSGDLIYHAGRYTRVISSTHYDSPTTTDIVEGYIVNPKSERACRDCHNVHSADITINEQWARSGHAGKILQAKTQYVIDNGGVLDNGEVDDHAIENVALYRAGGATDNTSGGGFTHYDWDDSVGSSPKNSFRDRLDCQMCHTATGFMNYVADPENYDPVNNDFSHLEGWADNGYSDQNELLFCWGCHSNNQGALRVSEAVTATYTYNSLPIVFPDVGDSNTCVVCHSGRGNNEVASDSSRFAGHHAPAAATLFAEKSHVAYEYPGQDYTPKSYFEHDGIEADGVGPCVACHMNGEEANHTFSVVDKDAAGVITAIKADVCVTCHDGEHALFVGEGLIGTTQNIWNGTAAVPTVVTGQMVTDAATTLEEESEGYQNAGALLQDIINQSNGLSNYTGAIINQNNLLENDRGAFQNAKLPSDEPGGFAHNRYYVKRAIFDAIDWAEDGSLDGVITDHSATYPAAIGWLGNSRP